MRKLLLDKNGEVEGFFIKGERNPCGCGSNVFHKEYNGKTLFGVCNACERDIYEYYDDQDYIDKSQWKDKYSNKYSKEKLEQIIDCNKCGMKSWCWVKDTAKDCPTAREILDRFMP